MAGEKLVSDWQSILPVIGRLVLVRRAGAKRRRRLRCAGAYPQRGTILWRKFLAAFSACLCAYFSGQDDNPQLFDGVLTPILIVFLPWAFKGKWLEEKTCWRVSRCCFSPTHYFLVDMRIRYILSIVPPLVILAVYGVFNLYLRIKRPVYLFAALMFFGGLAWHLSRKYFRKRGRSAISFGRRQSRRLSGSHAPRVHFIPVHCQEHAAEGENLSSLYRPESVLLRARLFS